MSNPAVSINRPQLRKESGLTLVEILITLVVISIGLLGVAGLHALSLRNNYDALMRSHASALASDIIDRMRANAAAVVDAGDYEVDFGEPPKVDEKSSQAIVDLNEWKNTLEKQLPTGDGSITIDAGVVTVAVRWGERGANVTFETQTEF